MEKTFRKVVRELSKMRTAVLLLAVVALASMAGTWWPQGLALHEYVAQFGVFWARVLWWTGLTDVYRAWWFVALLLVLMASVASCLWRNGPGMWAQVVGRTRGAWRWRVNRAGYFLVHGGVLGVALAGLLTGVWGWRGSLNLRDGETDNVVLVWRGSTPEAKFLPFTMENRGFDVLHYDTGMPSQFVTRLVCKGDGCFEGEQEVAVNTPLAVGDHVFYQASFGDGGSAMEGVGVDVRTGARVAFSAQVYEHAVLADGTRIELLDARPNTVEDMGNGPLDVGPSVDYLVQPPDAEGRQLRAYQNHPAMIGVADGQRADGAVVYRPVRWELGAAGEDMQDDDAVRAVIARMVDGVPGEAKLARAVSLWQQHRAVEELGLRYVVNLNGLETARYTGLMVAYDPGAWLFWPSAFLGVLGVVMMVGAGRPAQASRRRD